MGVQELFESFDKRKRKSHFKNLLAVAMADGNLENVEFNYIMHLAHKCYMSEAEVKRVIDSPQQINFVIPTTNREKFDQLYDLVTVMMVDGEIDPREMRLCKTIAMRFGFNPQIVDELIKGVMVNILKGVASEIALNELASMIED